VHVSITSINYVILPTGQAAREPKARESDLLHPLQVERRDPSAYGLRMTGWCGDVILPTGQAAREPKARQSDRKTTSAPFQGEILRLMASGWQGGVVMSFCP